MSEGNTELAYAVRMAAEAEQKAVEFYRDAAQKASKVVATDLNQDAVDDTAYNAKFHDLTHKIETRQGDLFGPVKDDEKFDVIIFNIDYPFNEKRVCQIK